MRVLICGDRDWGEQPGDRAVMDAFLGTLPEGAIVVEGEARGADSMAAELAEERGLDVDPHPADWRRYRRGAGPVRNGQMLDTLEPEEGDFVAAFHHDILSSSGTADCLRQAGERGVDWILIGDRLGMYDPALAPELHPAPALSNMPRPR